jgi:hypothetical protein
MFIIAQNCQAVINFHLFLITYLRADSLTIYINIIVTLLLLYLKNSLK